MVNENSDDDKSKTQKPIPSDDPECIYRIYSVISYFIVLVIIGIPIWWYTTRVYRASLPLNRMFDVSLKNTTDKQFGIPLTLEYDVLITIVNPDPQNLNVDIDGEVLERQLEPFLHKVSPIADFVVKSQWLYLVELGAVPRKIVDHYALYEDQLPHLITPLEKNLWSHLSPRPCLNLVLYISHCDVPLFIYNSRNEKSANAFFSPRWGGILITNPDKASCYNKNYSPDLQQITSIFISQLSKMLKMEETDKINLIELEKRRTEEMIESTRRTLKSLAQLLSEINSIVISDEVALKIAIAVENADLAEEALAKNDIESALNFSKIAFKNSEDAFSDPSLLALLYFPDDQKYAVYIPLFLPVMIPVIMSLLTVKKWYKENKQKLE